MKSSNMVVDHLNQQLTNELTAINQYFLHARIYRHWGLGEIGDIDFPPRTVELYTQALFSGVMAPGASSADERVGHEFADAR